MRVLPTIVSNRLTIRREVRAIVRNCLRVAPNHCVRSPVDWCELHSKGGVSQGGQAACTLHREWYRMKFSTRGASCRLEERLPRYVTRRAVSPRHAFTTVTGVRRPFHLDSSLRARNVSTKKRVPDIESALQTRTSISLHHLFCNYTCWLSALVKLTYFRVRDCLRK